MEYEDIRREINAHTDEMETYVEFIEVLKKDLAEKEKQILFKLV